MTAFYIQVYTRIRNRENKAHKEGVNEMARARLMEMEKKEHIVYVVLDDADEEFYGLEEMFAAYPSIEIGSAHVDGVMMFVYSI